MQAKQKPYLLVTGASRRLGASLVAHWLEGGYEVIATYRQENPVVKGLRQQGAHMLPIDIATEAGVTELVKAVQTLTGSLRAIVHNASVWHSDAEFAQSPELLATTYALHVFAPYRLNQALLPLLQAQSGPTDIVFISDASSDQGKPDKSLYTASKSAMESVMRSQAVAFAPKVKVNAVAPGLLAFHVTDDLAYQQRRLAQTLLGVEPGFKPVIDAIDFLLSNTYTTGTRLVVDGGAQLKRCQ